MRRNDADPYPRRGAARSPSPRLTIVRSVVVKPLLTSLVCATCFHCESFTLLQRTQWQLCLFTDQRVIRGIMAPERRPNPAYAVLTLLLTSLSQNVLSL